MRAAARGDRAAAERLARALLPRVRNLVRYLVRGDDEVDDIAQMALIDVLQGVGTFRGDAPVERWADRIVARATFRQLKRSRVRLARETLETEPRDPAAPTDAEQRYLSRRAAARVLDRLPEAQRVAVVLHHAAGFSVPEIADMEGVSPDTIKSRIRLGVGKLRATVGPEAAAEAAS